MITLHSSEIFVREKEPSIYVLFPFATGISAHVVKNQSLLSPYLMTI